MKKTIKELEKEIMHHRDLYYKGDPQIPDHDYDLIEDELRNLDPENKILNSVGHSRIDENKIKHKVPMLSMSKFKSIEDIKKWLERSKVVSNKAEFIVQPKIDGISGSVVYNDGKLVGIYTRGDGHVGEIISYSKGDSCLPKEITRDVDTIEIRGEFYINKKHKDSKSVNNAPLRNFCSGVLRRQDNTNNHLLSFCAYHTVASDGTITDDLNNLMNNGIEVAPSFSLNDISIEDIYKDYLNNLRSEWPYETDGLVLTVNQYYLHNMFDKGRSLSHHHHYNIALKPPSKKAYTYIEDISWNVSRTGRLIPVGILRSIAIDGIVISNVTFNNTEYFENLRLSKGDMIEIERANDVIPHIISVAKRIGGEVLMIPKKCPMCGNKTVRDGKFTLCLNPECRGRVIKQIEHWVNKCKMDGIGSSVIDDLYDHCGVKSIIDLYRVDIIRNCLNGLDGYSPNGSKVNKIINSILQTFNLSEVEILSNYGIPGIGRGVLDSNNINSLEELDNSTTDVEMSRYKVFQSYKLWKKENKIEYNKLYDLIHRIIQPKRIKRIQPKGKFCITGTLSVPRSTMIGNMENSGYIFNSSVNKNLDFLVCGKGCENTSKYKNAIKFGIRIIQEGDLNEIL